MNINELRKDHDVLGWHGWLPAAMRIRNRKTGEHGWASGNPIHNSRKIINNVVIYKWSYKIIGYDSYTSGAREDQS